MINIDLNYKKKIIHLIIESYILFIGGIFISYYVSNIFGDFNKDIFNKNENKSKYLNLLIEIFIQLTLLLFFSVKIKDSVKFTLVKIINHNINNVSMLSNLSYTPAIFIYQNNLISKLKFIFKNYKKLIF